jgi:hypothetical protein
VRRSTDRTSSIMFLKTPVGTSGSRQLVAQYSSMRIQSIRLLEIFIPSSQVKYSQPPSPFLYSTVRWVALG